MAQCVDENLKMKEISIATHFNSKLLICSCDMSM